MSVPQNQMLMDLSSMLNPAPSVASPSFANDWAGIPTLPSVTTNMLPSAGDGGGWLQSLGQWGQNNSQGLSVLGQGLGAFNSLANMYTGFKALGMAEDQFDFQKQAWNKNYNNQMKDYENTLKDRWTARQAGAAARGRDFQDMATWVDDRRLTGSYNGSGASGNKKNRNRGG